MTENPEKQISDLQVVDIVPEPPPNSDHHLPVNIEGDLPPRPVSTAWKQKLVSSSSNARSNVVLNPESPLTTYLNYLHTIPFKISQLYFYLGAFVCIIGVSIAGSDAAPYGIIKAFIGYELMINLISIGAYLPTIKLNSEMTMTKKVLWFVFSWFLIHVAWIPVSFLGNTQMGGGVSLALFVVLLAIFYTIFYRVNLRQDAQNRVKIVIIVIRPFLWLLDYFFLQLVGSFFAIAGPQMQVIICFLYPITEVLILEGIKKLTKKVDAEFMLTSHVIFLYMSAVFYLDGVLVIAAPNIEGSNFWIGVCLVAWRTVQIPTFLVFGTKYYFNTFVNKSKLTGNTIQARKSYHEQLAFHAGTRLLAEFSAVDIFLPIAGFAFYGPNSKYRPPVSPTVLILTGIHYGFLMLWLTVYVLWLYRLHGKRLFYVLRPVWQFSQIHMVTWTIWATLTMIALFGDRWNFIPLPV